MSAIACRMVRFSSLNKLRAGEELGPKDYLYLVIWVDYPMEEATWQTWGQLWHCDAAKLELSEHIHTGRTLTRGQLLQHNGDAERFEKELIGNGTRKYIKYLSHLYYSKQENTSNGPASQPLLWRG